ncbi:hypothetical protein EMIHUDRAFT_447696 [Emiliania huxleyi CCMP1516]|uniref:IBR domain-containing protein n=2 Tax=Emiliania huxleyi TaxID=2903 RepID=A0A0D3JH57_EMIH1|nr:hypothetical protein EMIHUDRAFT_447696 [Emiliania huxleyi CCMP1516]EOD22842.1 hypothetical protein EMIHUDRAFT_447696 [Emiliania huxleyi CCMP1516]|eukprot:XP_005775271.1 hypothetical protein EMIHUDRAFT_447696 [Emiliania huxleyi CCMP1516]
MASAVPGQKKPRRDVSGTSAGSIDEAAFADCDDVPIRRVGSDTTTCLDVDALRAAQAKKAKQVMDTLDVKQETARLLLRRTRPPWDVTKVFEAWYDEGDLDRLLSSKRQRCGASLECLVCCSSNENEVYFTLSCQHAVCTECLAGFLQSVLHPSDGVATDRPPFTCAQLGGKACDGGACVGVLEEEIGLLPLDEADAELLRAADAATSLDADGNYRRCPSCPKFNRPAAPGCVNLRCECGTHYCLLCGKDAHFPLPCLRVVQWQDHFIAPMATISDAAESAGPWLNLLRSVCDGMTHRSTGMRHRATIAEAEAEAAGGDRHVWDMLSQCNLQLHRPAREGAFDIQELQALDAHALLAALPQSARRVLEAAQLVQAEARVGEGLPELPRSGHDVEWLQLDSVLQGGVDVAAFLQRAEAKLAARAVPGSGAGPSASAGPSAHAGPSAPPDDDDVRAQIAAAGATLTHYQPDERERRRLRRAQHEDGGDSGEDSGGEDEWEDDEEHRRAFAQLRQQRGLDDMIARLPAVRFPFDRLVRAFALVGLSSDHRAADAARELQVHRDAERAEERERELTRCAAGFLAVHLNLNDLALLPGLREAYTRWRALNASLSAAATDAALAEQAEQAAASAIVDAKRLQLWLLADDWLCMASRLRGPGDTAPGLVNLRRENVQRHTDELRKLLDARATARRHRADGPSDGHLADRTSALHAEIAVLEQQLRDIYGLGAAFNNRVV